MIDQLFYNIGIDSNLLITSIKVFITILLGYAVTKLFVEAKTLARSFLYLFFGVVVVIWLWAGMGQGKLHRVNRETDGYTKHIEEVAKPIKTIKEIRKEADAKKPTQLSRQDTTVKADEIQALIDSALKRSKERDK